MLRLNQPASLIYYIPVMSTLMLSFKVWKSTPMCITKRLQKRLEMTMLEEISKHIVRV